MKIKSGQKEVKIHLSAMGFSKPFAKKIEL